MIKRFFVGLMHEYGEIRFAAASLAYSTLLSIVPFLVVVLAVFQSGVGLEALYPKIEALFTTYLKEATGTLAVDYIRTTLSHIKPKAFGATGIVLLMFTSVSLIRSIDHAFHRIWKIKMVRPAYTRIWFYWTILLIAPVALALVVGVRSISYFTAFSNDIENQLFIPIWPALILWVLYTFIPSVKVRFIASFPSALVAAIALNLVQDSFIWAAGTVFKRNKLYGSLASFPIFLLWLLVVWAVVLFGVSMCAFLQQRVFKKP